MRGVAASCRPSGYDTDTAGLIAVELPRGRRGVRDGRTGLANGGKLLAEGRRLHAERRRDRTRRHRIPHLRQRAIPSAMARPTLPWRNPPRKQRLRSTTPKNSAIRALAAHSSSPRNTPRNPTNTGRDRRHRPRPTERMPTWIRRGDGLRRWQRETPTSSRNRPPGTPTLQGRSPARPRKPCSPAADPATRRSAPSTPRAPGSTTCGEDGLSLPPVQYRSSDTFGGPSLISPEAPFTLDGADELSASEDSSGGLTPPGQMDAA